MTDVQERPNSLVILLLAVLALAFAMAGISQALGKGLIFEFRLTNHAKTSHVEQVSDIENCFNNGNKSNWFLQPNGRHAQHCTDDSGYAYWRISSCAGQERVVITQFKQTLKKLTRYIVNQGMVEGEPPPCN